MRYHIKLSVQVHAPVYGVSGLQWIKVHNEKVNAMLQWLLYIYLLTDAIFIWILQLLKNDGIYRDFTCFL